MRLLSNTFGEGQKQDADKKRALSSSVQANCRSNSSRPPTKNTTIRFYSNSRNIENNGGTWCEGNLLESPPKKMKMSNGKGIGSSLNHVGRSFGEEIDANGCSILDTSNISIETKDTAISGLTYDDNHSATDGTAVFTDEMIADPSSGVNNTSKNQIQNKGGDTNSNQVAHLRGWLDDFGKQHKQHFEKIHVPPPPEALDRPVRPKVARPPAVHHVTVPIATTQQMAKKPSYPSLSASSSSFSSTSTAKAAAPASSQSKSYKVPHPCLKQSTSQQSKINGGLPSQSSVPKAFIKSGTIHPSNPDGDKKPAAGNNILTKPRVPVRATPIRIKPMIKNEEVQATNDGYASVAKLSAWLASDPTSTKKLKQIRRGANVIAKSRKFDKELVNVVIEKTAIPRGGVSKQREIIERCCLAEESEDNEDEDGVTGNNYASNWLNDDTMHRTAKDWMNFGVPGSDVGICVSDKKKWLSSAFKKSAEDSDDVESTTSNHHHILVKASTEIITNRDRNDDVSNRAKQMWRTKYSPVRDTSRQSGILKTNNCHNNIHTNSPSRSKTVSSSVSQSQRNEEKLASKEQIDANLFSDSHESTSTLSSILSSDASVDVRGTPATGNPSSRTFRSTQQEEMREAAPSQLGRSPIRNPSTQHADVDEAAAVDFSKARELLVRRSKANGNPVDLSKVQQRKAKFEMMEREARRRSGPQGLLKTSWEDRLSSSSKGYVKKYVEDIAPKKSFEDLP